jgi:hypothetical protein
LTNNKQPQEATDFSVTLHHINFNLVKIPDFSFVSEEEDVEPQHGIDMSQGCSQDSKPKTGPERTQKENIPKQRKYKYFTSQKV